MASLVLKCSECGQTTHRGPANCPHCGASLKTAYQIEQPRAPAQPVTVTDVQIPFMSMVALTITWGLAAIPALIVLGTLGALFAGVIGVLLSPLF